jgi:hypothetical protein
VIGSNQRTQLISARSAIIPTERFTVVNLVFQDCLRDAIRICVTPGMFL